MDFENDILTGQELVEWMAQLAHDASTDGNYVSEEIEAMGWGPRRRTEGDIRTAQEQLQLLADSPQLRHRLGYGRVSVELPFADSRRATDPTDGSYRSVMDYSSPARDADRNYAAGLL
jgi:hypothetical protein